MPGRELRSVDVGVTRRFPRTARVRAKPDFDRIFKHGRRVALPVLALHWHDLSAAPADAPAAATAEPVARLGLAVSRKVDRRAVARNRIKRQLREAFREQRDCLMPWDLVVVARPGASQLSSDALRAAFVSLLRRAGASGPAALPPVPAPGTMPDAVCDVRTPPPLR